MWLFSFFNKETVMTTLSKQEFKQSESIVTNMFRYAYWVHLDKEQATKVVCSTLAQLPDSTLPNVKCSEQQKLIVLRYLQSECKKHTESQLRSRPVAFTNLSKSFSLLSRSKKNVHAVRVKLRDIATIDRAIFVLIYIWELQLAQVADILQISQERAENGFNETIKNLQEILPSN